MSSPTLNQPSLQEAERAGDPAPLEALLASIHDPHEIERLVVEGSSLQLRQLAAQRIEGREELNRLLKRLQGKDKSVYRILKDKRDALRDEAHQATQVEQDIRTIYTSLEALHARPYDALFAPALETFAHRWQMFESQAQPWARERVDKAIARCQAMQAEHQREIEQHAARLAEQSARESARQEAAAHEAQLARERDEAAMQEAAALEEVRRAEASARAEQAAAEAHSLRQISNLMARAHGAIRAGHSGPAAGLRRAIEEKLAVAPTLPPALARGMQELDAKLASLKEWKDYAVSPKRAELIAEMEALAGIEEAPQRLAERIRDLRAQWKTISQGVQVDSEADWERFNQAAVKAYEPCRIYFEEQARLRAENADKRRQVLERLRAFEARQDSGPPDWRAISTAVHEAPQAWRRSGPVERRAIREAEAEFDAMLARLRGRLEAWHAQNTADKRSLIERAAALVAKPDGQEAVDGIKRLQLQWRDIGPASRDVEQSLWNEFRAHGDAIFAQRQQAFAEHSASLDTHKMQALALCDEIEQLAMQSGAPLLEGAKRLPEWRAAFEALGELPRSEARALHQRFERALSRCEARLAQQHRHDAEQVFEHLLEAARRIDEYGWSVAQGTADEARAALKQDAESYIASVPQWPKNGAALLKEAWSRADSASPAEAASAEKALRMLCIRAEIGSDKPTPAEDQELRRAYQLQRLVQTMGQGAASGSSDWKSLVLEWVPVAPAAPEVYAALLECFRRCRTA